MGGSSSKSSSEIVSRTSVDAIARSIMNCSSNSSFTQTLDISGSGNTIQGGKQVQAIKLSAQCAQDSQQIADLQQSVSNALKQVSESQSVSLLGALGKSRSEVNSRIENDVRQSITQEAITNIINNSNAEQTIRISGDNNTVVNFTQEQTLEIVFSNTQKVLNRMTSVQALANAVDQQSTATQTNPISDILDSIGGILGGLTLPIIIAMIVGGAVLIFAGPKLLAAFNDDNPGLPPPPPGFVPPPGFTPPPFPLQQPTPQVQLQQQYGAPPVYTSSV